jgi:hypothetical protein
MAGGNLTLAQLQTAVRQRSDMETSGFISDSELTSYINQSYFELYDILVQKYGNEYFVASPYSFTSDGVLEAYPLPTDFYKFLGLDVQIGSSPSGWISVKPFMFAERNQWNAPNIQLVYGQTNVRYRLRADSIWLTPLASGGQNFRVWYVPKLDELVSDSDEATGVSGWLEYIIVDAAIKCLQKEESDVSVLMAQKQALIARIEAAAENRDQGNPQTVSDTSFSLNGFNGGFGVV